MKPNLPRHTFPSGRPPFPARLLVILTMAIGLAATGGVARAGTVHVGMGLGVSGSYGSKDDAFYQRTAHGGGSSDVTAHVGWRGKRYGLRLEHLNGVLTETPYYSSDYVDQITTTYKHRRLGLIFENRIPLFWRVRLDAAAGAFGSRHEILMEDFLIRNEADGKGWGAMGALGAQMEFAHFHLGARLSYAREYVAIPGVKVKGWFNQFSFVVFEATYAP